MSNVINFKTVKEHRERKQMRDDLAELTNNKATANRLHLLTTALIEQIDKNTRKKIERENWEALQSRLDKISGRLSKQALSISKGSASLSSSLNEMEARLKELK